MSFAFPEFFTVRTASRISFVSDIPVERMSGRFHLAMARRYGMLFVSLEPTFIAGTPSFRKNSASDRENGVDRKIKPFCSAYLLSLEWYSRGSINRSSISYCDSSLIPPFLKKAALGG